MTASLLSFLMSILFMNAEPITSSELWARENSYWNAIELKDIDLYAKLLHSDFSDWPLQSEKPISSKKEMLSFVKQLFDQDINIVAKISPLTTRIIGNTATLYFRCELKITDTSGESTTQIFRMIHGWTKVNEEWFLSSGMQSL